MPQPIKCVKCSRPYNPTFAACPFCKNPTVPVGSPTAGMKIDYVAYAERFAQDKIYLDVDFSLATITTLDVFIDDSWGTAGEAPEAETWKPKEGKWAVILNVGSYFGEVLRRIWGGQWIEDPDHGCDPLWTMVKLPPGITVFPIAKVYKRFKNGREDALEPLLQTLLPRLAVKPQNPESWLRQIAFFEKVKRFDLALIFYERLLRLPIPLSHKQQLEARMNQARNQVQHEATLDFVKGEEEIVSVLELAGVKPDHSPASLAGIDTWLYHYWGSEPKQKEEVESYEKDEWRLGCYLGEVFRRLGGDWRMDTAFPAASHIIWPSGFQTCPFTYFSKRLERGADYPVYAQFEFCRKLLIERKDIPAVGDESEAWLDQAEYQADSFTGNRHVGLQMALKALQYNPDSLRGHLLACKWTLAIGKEPAKAMEHLQRAADLGAEDVEIRRWRMRIFESQGEHAAQVEAARKVQTLVPEDKESRISEAMGLYALKRYAEALAVLEQALCPEAEPVEYRAWLRLGDCQYQLGRKDDALESWRKAQDWSLFGMEASWKLGQALEKRQQWQECLTAYRRVLDNSLTPAGIRQKALERQAAVENHPGYLEAEAGRLAGAGKTQEAVDIYRRLTAMNPQHADAWREQGVGLALLGRMEEALTVFDQAMAADPKDPKVYDHKAVTLGRMGRFDAGLALLEQGLEQMPAAASLWTRRSFFLGKLERWPEALASAEKALAIDATAYQPLLFKAEAQRRLQQPDAAIASLQQCLTLVPPEKQQAIQNVHQMIWNLEHPDQPLEPQKAAMLQDQAMALFQAGQPDQGLATFQAALAADSTSFEIWNNYGSVLMSLGRAQEALNGFERALALYPTMDVFQHNKALALERLGRTDEAAAVYDRIIERFPTDESTLQKRTTFLRRMERLDQALASAGQWITAAPRNVHALRIRAEILAKLKRFDESLTDYDRAIALSPNDRKIWLEKSVALADAGKTDESFELISKAFEDKAFADEYHRQGLDLLGAMLEPPGSRC